MDQSTGGSSNAQIAPATPPEADRQVTISGALPYDRKLSRPMVVTIEQDDGEILVSEPNFNMHAGGQTESDAIEAFRRIISGYVDFLENDEERLGGVASAQLAYLRSYIVPV